MSLERQAYWDERHRDGTPGAPEPSLVELLPMLPRGRVLDIAAGLGRNAIALAEAGMRVVAADYSAQAMRALGRIATEGGLTIEPVIADLEDGWPFRPASFDLVVNITFLDRALTPYLMDALKPDGMLFFDTFLIDQAESGHPRDPAFMLRHYELRDMLATMELLRYREGIVAYPSGKTAWRATALAQQRK
ncbi:MAG TPA: class I SAM-dependent methyltransferase [Candidatus Binataceae bacterium]|nr:class I SAM-dependent methyltransferase [Candidatus Binataceae bacterium]